MNEKTLNIAGGIIITLQNFRNSCKIYLLFDVKIEFIDKSSSRSRNISSNSNSK